MKSDSFTKYRRIRMMQDFLLKSVTYAASLAVVSTCLVTGVSAQLTFTATGLTQTQNFNGMSALELPAGFTVGGNTSVGMQTSNTTFTTGGSYKFIQATTDYAIGQLGSSGYTTSSYPIVCRLVNNTGSTITKLTVSFNYEKYRSGSREWNMTFSSGSSEAASDAQSAGNQNFPGDGNNTVYSYPPLSYPKTGIEITANIPQGGSYYLKWVLSGVGGQTNGQAIGIDDISVTATLAPACAITSPGTVTSTNGNSFCTTGATTLSLTGTNPSAGVSYQWKSSPDSLVWTNAGTSPTQPVNTGSTIYYKCIVTCASGTASDATPGYKITVTPTPSATISGTANVCSGAPATVTFNGTPDATVTYHAGTLSRSIILDASGTAAITRNFTADTTYTIVSVTDGTCGQSITGQQAIVHVHDLPAAVINGGTNVCSGDQASITFNGTPNSTVSYTANALSRTIVLDNAGTAIITRNFTADTTYTLVSVSDGTCPHNITGQQAAIRIHARPTAAISGSASLCAGESATISFNGTPDATVSYEAGTLSRTIVLDASGTASITRNFTGDTTYTIVSVTDGSCSGNISGQQAVVAAHPLPMVTVHLTGSAAICAGDSAILTAPAGTGYSYQWKNGTATGAADQSVTVRQTGFYSVVVTDAHNCRDSSSGIQITAYTLPVITITQPDTAFCDGNFLTLHVSAQDTGLAFRWQKDAVIVPNATAGFLEVGVTGNYTVIADRRHAARCADTSAPVLITIHPVVIPEIQWDGQELHAGKGFAGYQWFSGGSRIDTATRSSFVPAADGAYSVTATDTNGCVSTSRTYNLNGLNHVQVADLSSATRIRIYPNPANDILHIASPEAVHAILCSADGKLLLEQKQARSINISGFADGVYFLRVLNDKGILLSHEKVIKCTH